MKGHREGLYPERRVSEFFQSPLFTEHLFLAPGALPIWTSLPAPSEPAALGGAHTLGQLALSSLFPGHRLPSGWLLMDVSGGLRLGA